MKNIKVVGQTCCQLHLTDRLVVDAALNTLGNEAYFALSSGEVYCLDYVRKQVLWTAALLPLDAASGQRIVGFTHVMDLEALCVALSTGEILLVHLATREVEDVGGVEGGIINMCWSPDGEYVVIVSAEGNVLLMNQEWEMLAEVPLPHAPAAQLPDAGQGSFSTVGITWRGDGKYFATSAPLPSGGARLHVWDREGAQLHAAAEAADGLHPVVAWQPNCRHLYTAQRQEGGGAGSRVLLYERNGLLHGGFDLPADAGPIESLSWSPDSELLAVVARPLPSNRSSPWQVHVWHRSNWHWHLKWAQHLDAPEAGGRVLAVWEEGRGAVLQLVTGAGLWRRLQLAWGRHMSAMGTVAVVDGPSLLITPFRLGLVPPPMAAARAVLPAAAVDVAFCEEEGAAGGERVGVLLAGGQLAVLQSMEADLWEETAEELAEVFQERQGGPTTAAPSSYYPDAVLWPLVPELDLPLAGGRSIRALAWASPSVLVLLATPFSEGGHEGGPGDVLVRVRVEVELQEGRLQVAEEAEVCYAGGPVLLLASAPDGGVLLQLDSGALLHLSSSGRLAPLPPPASFPSPCLTMLPLPAPPSPGPPLPAPAVGLHASGALYWGAAQLADDCNSVAVRSDGPGGPALLYTTRSSHLHTVLLHHLRDYTHRQAAAVQLPMRDHNLAQRQGALGADGRSAMHAAMRPAGGGTRDVMVRDVEQGAEVVAVPQGGVQVVLQMPRGNLEGITPRALVLPAITLALSTHDYAAAWKLASTHRLDLNLLVDYRWPAFLSQAADFVRQVAHPPAMCDLLEALRPDSVTAEGGLYADALRQLPAEAREGLPQGSRGEEVAGADNKVAAVCRAVREAVQAAGESNTLQVVVTSYARCAPPELEAALDAIRGVKEEEVARGVEAGAADGALRHLLLTAEFEGVYRAALGLYDLALAYMVVGASQRDPGEYRAQLGAWAAVEPEGMRRARIDAHLGRWVRAMEALVAAGGEAGFEEALRIGRERGLLRELLRVVGAGDRAQAVLSAYGEDLAARGRHEDAAVTFMAGGVEEAALQAYRAAGQWQMAFALAGRLQYSKQQLAALAAAVAEDLTGLGQPAAAGRVLIAHLGDLDNGVLALCKGGDWQEAVRVSYSGGRPDLVDTMVAPSAAEAAAQLLDDCKQGMERIGKYMARWRDVRRRRAAMEAALGAEDGPDGSPGAVEEDGVSEAPSEVSGMSAYTDRTHTGGTATASGSSAAPSTVGGRRATRREKKGRKGGGIRAGTPAEEVALVGHVRGLGPRPEALEGAGKLGEVLVLLGHLEDARMLQQHVGAWLQAFQVAVEELDKSPPPPIRGPQPPPPAPPVDPRQLAEVRWKWDVLRAATGSS